MSRTVLLASCLAWALALAACSRAETTNGDMAISASAHPSPSARPTAGTATSPAGSPTASTAPAASGEVAAGPCPSDMVKAEGDYCPEVEQVCLKHARDYEEMERERRRARARGQAPKRNNVPERCIRYREPSRCKSAERVPMRFCIDRHEWPNRPGELPALLVTWLEADAACQQVGKRLCTGDEFNFACEGAQQLPYSYGYARDGERCNIDKPYVWPKRRLLPYRMCIDSTSCKEALDELDQREPIGARPHCTSPFGAYDLNGNVNEWVARPGRSPPFRSGLKGGWWGPARSRCRPMVIAHHESYVGYEVGFRCCKDAAPSH